MPPGIYDPQEVRYRISCIKDLPILSQGLQKLMENLDEGTASIKELERLIGYDPGLSAKVLRVANSAFYGQRGRVTNVSRAVAVLGFDHVKIICLCALLADYISKGKSVSAGTRERLWKHAFITARLSHAIAQKKPWIDKQMAFILGLLHDIGKLAMILHFPEHYLTILSLAEKEKTTPWCMELQYGPPHSQVGKWLAIRWGLPEEFQRVTEFHHVPDESPSCKAAVMLVGLANIMANSITNPDALADEITASYCGRLLIVEDIWKELLDSISETCSVADQMWNLMR